MSKAKFTASEWELVRNAPYWVNQALSAADGRVSFFTKRREGKALDKAINDYKTNNALINDIKADDNDAPKEIEKASQADAEKALNRIASIVEEKCGANDLAALQEFLVKIGKIVASSSKEGGKGNAAIVSDKEKAALVAIESAMKVSSSFATAHPVAKPSTSSAKPGVPAPKPSTSSAKPSTPSAMPTATAPKRDDEAKAKEEQEKKKAEALERQQKAREKAEAKQAEDRLEKAREEAEERQRAAAAEREAKAKAEAEAARKEAAATPKYTQFIAEHKVVAGDNLSFISEKYYGTQANFRIIYEANKDVIGDNMNLIRPGQVLKIPKL